MAFLVRAPALQTEKSFLGSAALCKRRDESYGPSRTRGFVAFVAFVVNEKFIAPRRKAFSKARVKTVSRARRRLENRSDLGVLEFRRYKRVKMRDTFENDTITEIN